MPVKHDLSQDLGFTKEALATLKDQDPHLAALIVKYTEADQKVLEAEAHNALGVTDEVLVALKEKRLKIKDDIVSRLDGQARH
ncbi:DUF465 domain-containing protein [Pseudomonas sp. 7P_10.2_Bac1]|uniref:DUF465 domain-containing protein n=1 Tax=Pseudomonas sp. 7P_10.2_Bac1 TaxID=2971614 RepID=UPI0021C79805|nr:DUF465 domain-containing protein [Pseudomonas sp. 7P_10.2_Bac1]MCU1727366.1 DUF465 domain-containing protein [Pseudomonas sp. 7P_10.2_Bac1]